MASMRVKKATATALTGAALAGALCAPGVSAAADESAWTSMPPPPSSIAASAGQAYEELRAASQVGDHGTSESQPAVHEGSTASGLDMPSAAIGAATGAGVVIMLLVAGGLARRRPVTREHGTVGA
jgi:hypothetical protein